ncbi:ComF family protein [Hoeflea sp. YIM 152468]|uniref:ComF family protein n=1 Tax=Hoeflea sp. YIM 152468 TaxID=3031759 RepID=UPI0023DABFF2|nr:ComF family protein [Hoeflea sp. YIM 152468]MDF1608017.1 ComF family protein [Hoeflea sp. YIM 152468]
MSACRHAGASLARLVYPPVCSGCGSMTGTPSALCAECWRTVRFIERPYCEVTGLPFDHDRGEGLVSPQAIATPPAYSRARAAVFHDGVARKMVHGLKYSDRADLARMMAGWMARAGYEVIGDSDVIIAVPLHRGRLLSRRYNQSAELARKLAGISGKRFLPGVLRRIRATQQQVGLGLRARQENVRGAFLTVPGQAQRFLGLKVLLIDDVLTTGATVEAATRSLLRAGAAQVNVLTFARVASRGEATLYA